MIRSFAHKGLENFFLNGTTRGIQPAHSQKLGDILDRLDASITPEDMRYPGSGLHKLKGKLKEHYSVKVSGNWRVLFPIYKRRRLCRRLFGLSLVRY